ncbi:hypothetical protein COV39_01220 [Candidatus Berkelbacteria bacterium CG11_big_fil_rev_8_21_14_0_20_40_23]|nr:MAG: hypothetical protein COV39_01220 [Candidatus Berkelbacteria bacterium CG11_big_fil_rev_8_21_14_0_20_40_23]PIX30492.1 MAG: hypothetical protein COZ62_02390 [Candidatus Berkelbacteria bacterium CG_4_8_14_3_um_filter_39_27]
MAINNIGIIYGGFKSQADINLDHAKAIASAFVPHYKIIYYNLSTPKGQDILIRDWRNKKVDFIFNNSAGKKGGDGTVEGFLDILGIPYVGSGMLPTAMAFDKKTTKKIVSGSGILVVKDLTIGFNNWKENKQGVINRIKRAIGYPLIVKASRGTDSIAVAIVKNTKELIPAIKRAFKEDDHLVIEEFVRKIAEVSCMVYGNKKNIEAFLPVQWGHEGDILETDEKFDVAKMTIPPKLGPTTIARIKKVSIIAHRILGCDDYSRSDLIISKNRKIYFLEINAHAGLGLSSSTVHMAKATKGWDHKKLINNILMLAVKRLKL